MKTHALGCGLAAVLLLAGVTTPAAAHHSFAMYDQTQTKTLTGKLTRYIPGSNHAQLIFTVLGPDGQPLIGTDGKPARWGVETGSAAAMARRGLSPKTFPEGTVFTVSFFPLRDGRPFGAMTGALIKCGAAMPAGGCTKDTGESLLVENN
ncbi:MAG: hypothetical protein HY824_15230 [Acidobacteria bacterium]|nr:hypothetical protein [Acidobacteriota bacterium]